MADVLWVQDEGRLDALTVALEERGHRILTCGGGPAPFQPCMLLRSGDCPVAEAADLILFGACLDLPMLGHTYAARQILIAYREHEFYGNLPMVVMGVGDPGPLPGRGPLVVVDSGPVEVVDAIESLHGATVGVAGV